jgi:hypothetical protein
MNDERILLSINHWRKPVINFEILNMYFITLPFSYNIKVVSRCLLNI